MKKINYLISFIVAMLSIACAKDPWANVENGDWNHERSIIDIKFRGQAGTPEIENIDESTGKISLQLATNLVEDMSAVEVEYITLSYNAVSSVQSGQTVDFTQDNVNITVTSPLGESRVYTLEMKEFSETLIGKYRVKSSFVWGGTGPSYGGATLWDPASKGWCWDSDGYGPSAEYDDYIEFELGEITSEGNTTGICMHYGGEDSKHWNCILAAGSNKEGSGPLDLHHHYRQIPVGKSKWVRNYSDNTITFTDASGHETVCSMLDEGEYSVYTGTSLKVETGHNAFQFALKGTDDWTNIYSDYDKFAKNPHTYYLIVEQVSEIPSASKTEGTEGELNLDPPPVVNVESIELADVLKNGLILEEGAVYNLDGLIKVLPEDATDKTLVYESSNQEVVTVTAEGMIMVAGAGSSIIKVSCGGITAEILIIVQPKAKVSLAGTYHFQLASDNNPNVQCFGGVADPAFVNPVAKSWVWDNSIWTMKDDVLVFTPTGTDADGNETGEVDYQSGVNGKYWNGIMIPKYNKFDPESPLDLSGHYCRLPQGKSKYVFDEKAATVVFTTADKVVVAKYLSPGVYKYGADYYGEGKEKSLTVSSTLALDFDLEYKGMPDGYDTGWYWSDFDRFGPGARNYVMCFDRQ